MKKIQARKYLPKRLKQISDDKLTELLNELELMAEVFIETIENSSKKHTRGY